jgi:hypothetical protein
MKKDEKVYLIVYSSRYQKKIIDKEKKKQLRKKNQINIVVKNKDQEKTRGEECRDREKKKKIYLCIPVLEVC